MRVEIQGEEFPFVSPSEWTYQDAAEAQRVTGYSVGQIVAGIPLADSNSALGYAVVAWRHGHQQRDAEIPDPIVLAAMTLDELIVDFTDPELEAEPEEDAEGPPAGGADAEPEAEAPADAS